MLAFRSACRAVPQVRVAQRGQDRDDGEEGHGEAEHDRGAEAVVGDEGGADGRSENDPEGDERGVDGVDQRPGASRALDADGHGGVHGNADEADAEHEDQGERPRVGEDRESSEEHGVEEGADQEDGDGSVVGEAADDDVADDGGRAVGEEQQRRRIRVEAADLGQDRGEEAEHGEDGPDDECAGNQGEQQLRTSEYGEFGSERQGVGSIVRFGLRRVAHEGEREHRGDRSKDGDRPERGLPAEATPDEGRERKPEQGAEHEAVHGDGDRATAHGLVDELDAQGDRDAEERLRGDAGDDPGRHHDGIGVGESSDQVAREENREDNQECGLRADSEERQGEDGAADGHGDGEHGDEVADLLDAGAEAFSELRHEPGNGEFAGDHGENARPQHVHGRWYGAWGSGAR